MKFDKKTILAVLVAVSAVVATVIKVLEQLPDSAVEPLGVAGSASVLKSSADAGVLVDAGK